MARPQLPASVRVLPGTDLERAWDVFERFEALHHRMSICNPMADDDLEALVVALDPRPGMRVIDLACGHGELLLRLAARAQIEGVGVDLSPWALVRASDQAAARGVADRVEWWLADAEELAGDGTYDVASALGASWIWDGYAGTARALASFVRPGGTVVVADLFRRSGVTPADVEHYGEVPTYDELHAAFEAAGLAVVADIDTTAESWHDYQRRIAESAAAWVEMRPGPAAEGYRDDAAAWAAQHPREPELVGWNVRIGRKR